MPNGSLLQESSPVAFLTVDEQNKLLDLEGPFQTDWVQPGRVRPSALLYFCGIARKLNEQLLFSVSGACDDPPRIDEDALLEFISNGVMPDIASSMWHDRRIDWRMVFDAIDERAGDRFFPTYDSALLKLRIGYFMHEVKILQEKAERGDAIARAIDSRVRRLSGGIVQRWFPRPPSPTGWEQQRAYLIECLVKLRADLLARLLSPIRELGKGAAFNTEFIGMVRYVANQTTRQIEVQLVDRHGVYHTTSHKFDLFAPLKTWDWLKHYVEVQTQKMQFLLSNSYDPWLVECLRRELLHLGVMPELHRRMRKAITPDRDLLRIALRQLPARRWSGLKNSNCNDTWSNLLLDLRLFNEARRFTDLFHRAYFEKFISRHNEVATLKAKLKDLGITEAGWKLLCAKGSRAYSPVLKHWPSAKLDRIITHLKLLQALNSTVLPPDELMEAVYEGHIIDFERDVARLPPQVIRAAWRHLATLTTRKERQAFLGNAFKPVLYWLRYAKPVLDQNQLQAPWVFWERSKSEWLKELEIKGRSLQWKEPIAEHVWGDYRIVPLSSELDLHQEGYKMRHCLAVKLKQCLSGDYLCFSIRDRVSGRSILTVGIERHEPNTYRTWMLEQVRGFANRFATEAEVKVGRYICELLNQQSKSVQLHRLGEPRELLRDSTGKMVVASLVIMSREHDAFLKTIDLSKRKVW